MCFNLATHGRVIEECTRPAAWQCVIIMAWFILPIWALVLIYLDVIYVTGPQLFHVTSNVGLCCHKLLVLPQSTDVVPVSLYYYICRCHNDTDNSVHILLYWSSNRLESSLERFRVYLPKNHLNRLQYLRVSFVSIAKFAEWVSYVKWTVRNGVLLRNGCTYAVHWINWVSLLRKEPYIDTDLIQHVIWGGCCG